MTEHLTETQRIEDRIVKACATIREAWPHMLPTGAPGRRPGGGAKNVGIVADNSDPERNSKGRLTWPADETESDDLDSRTRLIGDRQDITAVLNSTARLILDDEILPHLDGTNRTRREKDEYLAAILPDGLDAPALAEFIERHARWLSGHEAAPDVADELRDQAVLAERLGRPRKNAPDDYQPRPPRPRLVGTCPQEWPVEDESGQTVMRPCGGNVLAYPTPFTDPTRVEQMRAPLPTCDHCDTAATLDWWYQEMYGRHGLSSLVTVDELIAVIAVRLDWIVSRERIRVWKHRGKISSEGKDSKGRSLYRHADVVEAIRDDVEREKEKRA